VTDGSRIVKEENVKGSPDKLLECLGRRIWVNGDSFSYTNSIIRAASWQARAGSRAPQRSTHPEEGRRRCCRPARQRIAAAAFLLFFQVVEDRAQIAVESSGIGIAHTPNFVNNRV
jgi:hypothetical protein